MKSLKSLFALLFVFCAVPFSNAQYPTIPKEVQAVSDSMMAGFRQASDSAWAVALPIVEKEALEGRPYIPWANRPYDLPQAEIPSFPGAEGGGAYTFGGRGGKVLIVTNLNDAGPGSLRWACEQGGARIVVFNVAGTIHLKTPISVRAPYITIAGQTAPGDGICVASESFWVDTHDVVVRHMRFRRGITTVGRRDDSFGGNPVGNIMLDHISATWGCDENISFYRHMYNDGNGGIDREEAGKDHQTGPGRGRDALASPASCPDGSDVTGDGRGRGRVRYGGAGSLGRSGQAREAVPPARAHHHRTR